MFMHIYTTLSRLTTSFTFFTFARHNFFFIILIHFSITLLGLARLMIYDHNSWDHNGRSTHCISILKNSQRYFYLFFSSPTSSCCFVVVAVKWVTIFRYRFFLFSSVLLYCNSSSEANNHHVESSERETFKVKG